MALTSIAVLVALAATSGPTSPTRQAAEIVAPEPAPSVIFPRLDGPASVSAPSAAAPTSPLVRDVAVAQVGSPSDIPSLALAAYQRADAVLGSADAACRLPWTLLAAVGRVESDHGRFGGSALDDQGVARPAILGPRLDGSHATARLRDSDAGVLDGDRKFDRAVGPMQFIPSTWSVVGVDADGDGARNPQDIDDAALAAGVYLCAGGEDLSTEAGRTKAVHRYNHSDEYVALVLRIMSAYERSRTLTGSFTTEAVFAFDPGTLPAVPTVPRRTTPTDDATPDNGWLPGGGPSAGPAPEPTATASPKPTPTATPTATASPSPTATPPRVAPTPTAATTPTPTEPAPTASAPTPTAPATTVPTATPTEPADSSAPTPTAPAEPTGPAPAEPAPGEPTEPVPAEPSDPAPADTTPVGLPSDAAIAVCTDLGYVDDPADPADAYDRCVADYDLVVAVQNLCADLGYVDDPAREDDDFDQCVIGHLPARLPSEMLG